MNIKTNHRRKPYTMSKAAHAQRVAALREALEAIRDEAYERIIDGLATDADWLYKTAKAALSAPSRNCDRLSADQCKKMFEYEMEVYFPKEATDRDRDIARIVGNGVIDALFAQSTERKGERRWKQVM